MTVASGMKIDLDHALHAAHPEDTLTIDDGSDAARDASATLEGLLDAAGAEVVEIETCIAAYP